MKLLTFLGTGKYSETKYTWNDQTCYTCYAMVASTAFLQPDEVIVFATEEAEQTHARPLREALNKPIRYLPVPDGRTVAELWLIFSQVATSVTRDEEVAFDVTHGLRSFPLIGLLAAAYLRAGLGVNLRAVMYGAFDVRDQTVTPSLTPMFDLSPMLTLLEWASAAERFNQSGDARPLASLLRQPRKEMALAAQDSPEQLEQIGHLGNLADALEGISQALRLIRPQGVMQQAVRLEDCIQRALPMLEGAAQIQPFRLLLDRVAQTYQPLGISDPNLADKTVEVLYVQLTMIRWYADREQWVQAVALAREWLLSWVMLHLNQHELTRRDTRQIIENVVGAEASEYKKAKQEKRTFSTLFLSTLPKVEQALDLWLSLTDVRNDILHAGMRPDPKEPKSLINNIEKNLLLLESLPL